MIVFEKEGVNFSEIEEKLFEMFFQALTMENEAEGDEEEDFAAEDSQFALQVNRTIRFRYLHLIDSAFQEQDEMLCVICLDRPRTVGVAHGSS